MSEHENPTHRYKIPTNRPKVPIHRPKIPAYRPKLHIKKPRMYLETNRVCCKCESNKTYSKTINRVQWHREINDNGKWTGKWLCSICYHKEYYKKRRREAELARKIPLEIKEKQ